MGETSKGVVVALLVIAIVVSVFSTIIMVNTVDNKVISFIPQSALPQGQISVNILENPEPSIMTGQVSLTILPKH